MVPPSAATQVHEDRRKKGILDWIVPALLGLIGVLLALGAASMTSAIQDQASQTRGLREDLAAVKAHIDDNKEWQSQIESRIAVLESNDMRINKSR
jgi:cell division protein FtsB